MPAYGQPLGPSHGLGQKRDKPAKMDEFNRKYHSVERVLWMHRQPSVISGDVPCVNAHIGIEGIGMKADYTHVVPLTKAEHDLMSAVGGGIGEFCLRYSVTIEWLLEQAAETERRWQEYQAVPRDF